jgi:hypothetical protein
LLQYSDLRLCYYFGFHSQFHAFHASRVQT